MDKYLTIMVIPEREKGVKSYRIPRALFRSFIFVAVAAVMLVMVLGYDYWQILQQVYQSQHLTIENRQLKEQIQLFQMKLNGLTDDLERIHIFEQKLRVITGLENADLTRQMPLAPGLLPGKAQPPGPESEEQHDAPVPEQKAPVPEASGTKSSFSSPYYLQRFKDFRDKPQYLQLKNLYEQKIASTLGLQAGYHYTKNWSVLTSQSFGLAESYASFDYSYQILKEDIKTLEKNVHELDQHLLDKDSFLKSTPTLLPALGWITSYYGPRQSHYAGRIKMHEGLDIGARTGTPIVATADGVVTYSGRKPGFGKFVQIDHGYGIETVFAHADQVLVDKGQVVKRGNIVAKVGSTGYSTGPHVHYEVRVNGTPVDPLYFILD